MNLREYLLQRYDYLKEKAELFFKLLFIFITLIMNTIIAFNDFSGMSFVIYFIIYLFCKFNAVLIHETVHFLLFKLFGLIVVDYEISVFCLKKVDGRFKFFLKNNPLYMGNCTCLYDKKVSYKKYFVALCGGSFINVIIGVGLFIIYIFIDSKFMICQSLACFMNFIKNLLLPDSTDRYLMKRIKEELEWK